MDQLLDVSRNIPESFTWYSDFCWSPSLCLPCMCGKIEVTWHVLDMLYFDGANYIAIHRVEALIYVTKLQNTRSTFDETCFTRYKNIPSSLVPTSTSFFRLLCVPKSKTKREIVHGRAYLRARIYFTALSISKRVYIDFELSSRTSRCDTQKMVQVRCMSFRPVHEYVTKIVFDAWMLERLSCSSDFQNL